MSLWKTAESTSQAAAKTNLAGSRHDASAGAGLKRLPARFLEVTRDWIRDVFNRGSNRAPAGV
jgi:hypothetical protein